MKVLEEKAQIKTHEHLFGLFPPQKLEIDLFTYWYIKILILILVNFFKLKTYKHKRKASKQKQTHKKQMHMQKIKRSDLNLDFKLNEEIFLNIGFLSRMN